MSRSFKRGLAWVCATALGGAAHAQSLAGNVGSASISPGERALEFRVGTDDAGAAQSRLHYQHGLSDWYQLRAIATFRKPADEAWDYSGLTLENWFQWSAEDAGGDGFNGGLRLAYTLADGDRSDEVAVRVTMTDRFREDWEWRVNLIAGFELASEAVDGADLESRVQLTRSLPVTFATSPQLRLGAELFSEYGNSRDLPGLDQQAHQIGPVLKVEWDNGLFLNTAVRFGLTRGADDQMVRLLIGRSF